MGIKREHELHVGMRNVKTALAVFVSMLVFALMKLALGLLPESGGAVLGILRFVLNRGDPVFACVAAVIVMQSTVEGSVKLGTSRIWGTATGGAFGIGFLWLDNHILDRRLNMLLVVVGVIVLIAFCNYFNRRLSVSIATITFLIIMINVDHPSPYIYAFNRIFDTAIGVVISIAVNYLVKNPNRRKRGARIDSH